MTIPERACDNRDDVDPARPTPDARPAPSPVHRSARPRQGQAASPGPDPTFRAPADPAEPGHPIGLPPRTGRRGAGALRGRPLHRATRRRDRGRWAWFDPRGVHRRRHLDPDTERLARDRHRCTVAPATDRAVYLRVERGSHRDRSGRSRGRHDPQDPRLPGASRPGVDGDPGGRPGTRPKDHHPGEAGKRHE